MPILDVIARLPWRAAKPQTWGLHEYTVRSPETEADFTALFEAIQARGQSERWRGRKKKYLHVGEFKYWSMTTHRPSTRIINRMLIIDDLARLRAEGQAE